MPNIRRTKTILFLNIMLLIALAATSLIGATVALFTSESGSIIRVDSGKVEIDLLQADNNGEYFSIRNTNGEVFGGGFWEPGHTRVVFLKIKSSSSIKIKYSLRLNVDNEDMKGAFEYFAYRGDYFDTKGMSYEEIRKNVTPNEFESGKHSLSGHDYVEMQPGEEHTYVLVLHMKENGGNHYQGQSCTVDLNAIAIQGNAPDNVEVTTNE